MNWEYLAWTIGLGLASLFAGLVGVVFTLVILPPTFFLDSHDRNLWIDQHAVIRWSGRILKNLAGIFLILLGGLLSIPGIPGQGILTILIGLTLLDFPGKRRLERWILAWQPIHDSVNRIRTRFGRRPFVLDDS